MTVTPVTVRTVSLYRTDRPYPGARRMVDARTRSAEKPGKRDRKRYRMAWAGLPCSLCGLRGGWLLPLGHPARLTFGHTVPLTHYGVTNVHNLSPQHAECNATARDRDLTHCVDHRVSVLPSLKDAAAWEADGGPVYSEPEPDDLPTVAAMRLGRAGRGCGF